MLLAVGVAVADAVRVLAVGVLDAMPVTVPACPPQHRACGRRRVTGCGRAHHRPGTDAVLLVGTVVVEPAVTLAVGVLGAVRVLAVGVVDAVPVPVLCNTLPVK